MNSCIASKCPYKYVDENGDLRCRNGDHDCPCSVPANTKGDDNDKQE